MSLLLAIPNKYNMSSFLGNFNDLSIRPVEKKMSSLALDIEHHTIIVKDDDQALKNRIKQVMELTNKSSDEAAFALHDADHDVNKAVNMLLEATSEIKSEWKTNISKKKKPELEKNKLKKNEKTKKEPKVDLIDDVKKPEEIYPEKLEKSNSDHESKSSLNSKPLNTDKISDENNKNTAYVKNEGTQKNYKHFYKRNFIKKDHVVHPKHNFNSNPIEAYHSERFNRNMPQKRNIPFRKDYKNPQLLTSDHKYSFGYNNNKRFVKKNNTKNENEESNFWCQNNIGDWDDESKKTKTILPDIDQFIAEELPPETSNKSIDIMQLLESALSHTTHSNNVNRLANYAHSDKPSSSIDSLENKWENREELSAADTIKNAIGIGISDIGTFHVSRNGDAFNHSEFEFEITSKNISPNRNTLSVVMPSAYVSSIPVNFEFGTDFEFGNTDLTHVPSSFEDDNSIDDLGSDTKYPSRPTEFFNSQNLDPQTDSLYLTSKASSPLSAVPRDRHDQHSSPSSRISRDPQPPPPPFEVNFYSGQGNRRNRDEEEDIAEDQEGWDSPDSFSPITGGAVRKESSAVKFSRKSTSITTTTTTPPFSVNTNKHQLLQQNTSGVKKSLTKRQSSGTHEIDVHRNHPPSTNTTNLLPPLTTTTPLSPNYYHQTGPPDNNVPVIEEGRNKISTNPPHRGAPQSHPSEIFVPENAILENKDAVPRYNRTSTQIENISHNHTANNVKGLTSNNKSSSSAFSPAFAPLLNPQYALGQALGLPYFTTPPVYTYEDLQILQKLPLGFYDLSSLGLYQPQTHPTHTSAGGSGGGGGLINTGVTSTSINYGRSGVASNNNNNNNQQHAYHLPSVAASHSSGGAVNQQHFSTATQHQHAGLQQQHQQQQQYYQRQYQTPPTNYNNNNVVNRMINNNNHHHNVPASSTSLQQSVGIAGGVNNPTGAASASVAAANNANMLLMNQLIPGMMNFIGGPPPPPPPSHHHPPPPTLSHHNSSIGTHHSSNPPINSSAGAGGMFNPEQVAAAFAGITQNNGRGMGAVDMATLAGKMVAANTMDAANHQHHLVDQQELLLKQQRQNQSQLNNIGFFYPGGLMPNAAALANYSQLSAYLPAQLQGVKLTQQRGVDEEFLKNVEGDIYKNYNKQGGVVKLENNSTHAPLTNNNTFKNVSNNPAGKVNSSLNPFDIIAAIQQQQQYQQHSTAANTNNSSNLNVVGAPLSMVHHHNPTTNQQLLFPITTPNTTTNNNNNNGGGGNAAMNQLRHHHQKQQQQMNKPPPNNGGEPEAATAANLHHHHQVHVKNTPTAGGVGGASAAAFSNNNYVHHHGVNHNRVVSAGSAGTATAGGVQSSQHHNRLHHESGSTTSNKAGSQPHPNFW